LSIVFSLFLRKIVDKMWINPIDNSLQRVVL
jgi:hypothetical protein